MANPIHEASGPSATPLRPANDRSLRQTWVVACVVGELLGFVPPAAAGVAMVALDAPELIVIVALVLAGIGEGAILGAAQSRALADIVPGVTGWTVATAQAAGIAWFAGMGGSSLIQSLGVIALVIAIPLWVVGLLSMGFLQSRRLAPVVGDANRWIPVTTLAWLIGVMLPVVALSIIPNGWPLVVHAIAAVGAAVAMGATVGAISGPTLQRLAEAERAASG